MNKIFEAEKKRKNYDLFYQDREVFPDTLRKFVKNGMICMTMKNL